VQLDEIQAIHAEVDPRPVGPGAEVLQHVVLRDLRAHLGGDRDALAVDVGDEPPADPLAAPVAVHVRRVEEGDAGLDGLSR
jgi:hypothetical protein